MRVVQRVGDDHAEHRVAEELQTLVGRQTAVLVGIRAVGQRQLKKLGVEFDPELRGAVIDGSGVASDADPDDNVGQTPTTWRPSY